VQNHTPALRGQFVDIRSHNLGGGIRLNGIGLYLFADTVNCKVSRLRALVTDDMKVQRLALAENLLPAMAT